MPAPVFDDEDSPPYDPDDLKMPESPRHRRTCDLIGLAAANLLGADHDVFRDMNWYPPDGGTAMAPDVMVLPAGAWVPPSDSSADEPLKSYRQDLTGGPVPLVAVEVPSGSDGFLSLLEKAYRCQRLGAVVYLVTADGPRSVLRLAPQAAGRERPDPESWVDRPITELGGIRITFDEHDVVVVLPDGTSATSDEALLAAAQLRAEQAQLRAEQALLRADEAERRADAMVRQLRDLGVDPADEESPPPPGT